jgi:hypothetical protein
MKRKIEFLVIVAIICMVLGYVIASAAAASIPADQKFDGECDPSVTVGRCADKCPEGQFQRGTDKETGAAVCALVTGCPYGDSIPLDPECDKFKPVANAEQSPAPSYADSAANDPVSDFQGK